MLRAIIELNLAAQHGQSILWKDQAEERFSAVLGEGFGYTFTDDEFGRIQELINDLRDMISKSKIIDDKHQRRLLKRLEKLQAEAQERRTAAEKVRREKDEAERIAREEADKVRLAKAKVEEDARQARLKEEEAARKKADDERIAREKAADDARAAAEEALQARLAEEARRRLAEASDAMMGVEQLARAEALKERKLRLALKEAWALTQIDLGPVPGAKP